VKREAKRGFAPSLKSPPPLLAKERGIKGVRLVKTLKQIDMKKGKHDGSNTNRR
jgi:hypothetical protein